MKNYVFLPIYASLIACQSFASESGDQERLSMQKEFLLEAIESTPYSAVIKHTGVEVFDVADNKFASKHVYSADVIETIRGEKRSNIRYAMLVEHGEEATMDSYPVIISLCKRNGDYYWPGVGAQFGVNELLVKLAEDHASKVDNQQSHFAHCDGK